MTLQSKPLLTTTNLTRRFGGLVAVNDVNLELQPKRVHAILGPNGAGKSTLINMLSGEMPPSTGSIIFNGQPIHGKKAYHVARLGVGRSHQKTNIFPRLTCLQNCELAARANMGGVLASWRSQETAKQVTEKAYHSLQTCQLLQYADTISAVLSYGAQRQLQIAMVLATSPTLMLLDEPMAGMGREETEQVTELLRQLSNQYTLVLIEHDMDTVFALADDITVMVDGTILETGLSEDIRRSEKVRDVYLGRENELEPH